MIRIRFVTSTAFSSRLIRLQAGVSMPFTPSHTEALSQDGKSYIGAHLDGGIMRRPVGYDADTLMDLPDNGGKSERIVSIPCTPEQETVFYTYVEKHVGEPYDWQGILGFVATEIHLHDVGTIFCSAFMTGALREAKIFPWPLTVPFHHISPRDLMLMLSSHVEIPH